MSNIVYKDETPDVQQYLDLFNSTGWNTVYKASAKELRRALEDSWFVMTAYDGNELVGSGRVVSDGVLYAMIYDMIVKPSHQGRGIGTTILSHLIDRCSSAGLRDVQLFSAKGKAPFYKRHGFVERPEDAPGMRLNKNQVNERVPGVDR
jgi:GNAT superfamily N-acetyltransferase